MKNFLKIGLSVLFFLLAQTASAQYSILSSHNSFQLKPGVNIESEAKIINDSGQKIFLKIYAADAIKTNSGGFAVGSEENARNLGKWTTIEEPTITLLPREQKNSRFSITIPDNAETGDYAGGIVIQAIDPDTKNVIEGSSRAVAALYVSVGDKKTYDLQVESFKYSDALKNQIDFELKIKNSGNAKIKAHIKIIIEELWGLIQYELPPKDIFLYKNESITLPFIWDKNPILGIFKAKAQIVTSPDLGKIEPSLKLYIIKWDKVFIGISIIIALALVIHFRKK